MLVSKAYIPPEREPIYVGASRRFRPQMPQFQLRAPTEPVESWFTLCMRGLGLRWAYRFHVVCVIFAVSDGIWAYKASNITHACLF